MASDPSSLELAAVVEHVQIGLSLLRLSLNERSAGLSPDDNAAVIEHVHVLAASLGNLRRLIHRCEARARNSVTIAASTNRDTRGHCCECCCVHCERNGTGYFAQRAALDGDKSAAERLSPAIYATLTAERASRLTATHKKVSA